MRIKPKGISGGFGYVKTSLGVGFLHKNACFLVKSEDICTINHVISYKRGGFQKPQCEIFLVSILKNAYLVRKLTTKKKRAADELLLLKRCKIIKLKIRKLFHKQSDNLFIRLHIAFFNHSCCTTFESRFITII